MKLIVGLGNIGKDYASTRHNLGFMVLDELITVLGASQGFTRHSKTAADILDLRASNDCILVKPRTMMNLSGQAVGEIAHYYKIDSGNIWTVYDDVDVAFGQVRVRQGGGSAGHNGIKSLISHIGPDFWRIRMGVRNEFFDATATDQFVLDRFNTNEAKQIPEITRSSAQYISEMLAADGLTDHTQNIITK